MLYQFLASIRVCQSRFLSRFCHAVSIRDFFVTLIVRKVTPVTQYSSLNFELM